MNEVEETLKQNEAYTFDFSENYAFIVQDEAQSYHWSSNYITIHPFVIYYKQDDKVKYVSYFVISEFWTTIQQLSTAFKKSSFSFSKIAFSLMFRKYITFPTEVQLNEILKFQYKINKNFSNLCFHTKILE